MKFLKERKWTSISSLGKSGDIVNVEAIVNSVRPSRGEIFDGRLRLFGSDGSLIAENDDELEGTKDPSLLDVYLPEDGDYFLEVSLSEQPAFASKEGRYELFISKFRAVSDNEYSSESPGDFSWWEWTRFDLWQCSE